MVDRFLLWLGAGAVCAGVTAGMLAGAGTAYAQPDGDGDGNAKTSQSAKPGATNQDSGTDAKKTPRHKRNHAVGRTDTKPKVPDGDIKSADGGAKSADGDAKPDAGATEDDNTTDEVIRDDDRKAGKPAAGKRTPRLIEDVVTAVTRLPDRKAVAGRTGPADPVRAEKPDPVAAIDAIEPRERSVPVDKSPEIRLVRNVRETWASTATASKLALDTPMLAQPKITAAVGPPIDVPPVISAIGTLVFGLISLAESVFEGPPMALPGSGVTVKRSTLVIGDQEVPADWYFPEGSLDENGTPPEHVIYLQHGFLARGVFYDYTASYLAQQTNSVVVAPTLTSNIFATDGMWLGGTQMHQAVADLFTDATNDELLNSAQAAGYTRDELPHDVVLVGHSLGGGLVIDTARYISANEGGSAPYHLAGVLMLDGVSFTDPVPILQDIPDSVPVYNLSATPYMWNLFGTMDAALAQVRPDDFHGAQLLGGLHSDSMIGGNPLVQFGAYLLTGFSLPTNVAGSQILAATWINDMFDCQNDADCKTPGFYGQPGDTLTIPTPVGPAFALVQPQPGVIDTVARQLTAVFIGLLANINFATDVPAGQETLVAA